MEDFFFLIEEAATKCLRIPTPFSKSCLLSLKVWKALNEKSLTQQVTMKGSGLSELETGLYKIILCAEAESSVK